MGAVGALAVVGSTIAIATVAPLAQAKSKPLTKSAVISLIKKYSKPGPKGTPGPRGLPGKSAPTYTAGTGLTLAGSVFSIDPNSTVFGAVVDSAVNNGGVSIPAGTPGVIASTPFSSAGNYIVIGTTSVQNATASPVGFFCFLETVAGKIAAAQETVPPNDSVNLTVQGRVVPAPEAGAGGVALDCVASAASALTTVTNGGLTTSAVTAIKAAGASLLP